MRRAVARTILMFCAAASMGGVLVPHSATAAGTTASAYVQVNLTSDVVGMAHNHDANLVNPWGVAFFPGNPFWVSDNGTGLSTLYDSHGVPQGLVVTIPAAPEQPSGTIGSPTGIVANGDRAFVVTENGHKGASFFLFSTLDGTISGWNPGVDVTHAVIGVDNFSAHALYTGLALAQTDNGPRLFAADAVNNRVDVFGGNFQHLFSFTDPHVPHGLSAYGVHILNAGLVAVAFATPASNGGGVVDFFDVNGKFVRRFATSFPGGILDAPWAVVIATKNFGRFSNDVLVGNVGNGRISAFDFKTGTFLGQLEDAHGNKIANPGLWSLTFGSGGSPSGSPDELFFSAGINGYADGLFGKIVVAP